MVAAARVAAVAPNLSTRGPSSAASLAVSPSPNTANCGVTAAMAPHAAMTSGGGW